jgi:hypothetical protein
LSGLGKVHEHDVRGIEREALSEDL